MRIARRCRRCAARAVVAVDARADTDANCASHRVLQHVDESLAVDNAMCVAQASVLLAQFGVSFDPFGGAKSRVTVSAYSAPRLAEARQRPARAALGACCHRCVGGAHVLDDRFGRRRRLGRAVVRRSAPDARVGFARQHVVLHIDVHKRHCRTSSMRASLTRARWSIRSLICSPRTAPELEKERDARVAGALHTLTLLAGVPDIMLPTQRLQLLTMVCTHGAKFDRLQVAGASQRARFVARDILRLVHAPAHQRRRSRRGDRPVFGRGAGGRRALALPHAGVGRADDVRAGARRRDRGGAERARRGALCEQRRRSAAAAARDRAVGDRVAAAALQATFDDRRRACVAQRR
jgi:hypothetical protein